MGNKTHKGLAVINARITAVVSVSLVLLILGIAAFTAIITSEITKDIKENLGFDVSLVDDVAQEDVTRVHNILVHNPAVREAVVVTPDEAAKEWEADMGENVIELCDVNPFPTVIEVKVKAKYAASDSIAKVTDYIRKDRAVSNISLNSDLIDSITDNTQTLYLILSLIGVALLLISFVLINNTVHLTVYSRRFLIHTMKLVGATHGFIRRPFIIDNVINGAIAGLLADIVLLLFLLYGPEINVIYAALKTEMTVIVFSALILTGIVICAIASLLAANKYLGKEYDEMFE